MCYWKEKVPGTYHINKRFPCFLLTEGDESKYHIYGLPSLEYPGLVKVGPRTGTGTRTGPCLGFLTLHCSVQTQRWTESVGLGPSYCSF